CASGLQVDDGGQHVDMGYCCHLWHRILNPRPQNKPQRALTNAVRFCGHLSLDIKFAEKVSKRIILPAR
ncbi:MAG TPA: hypothetical protein V6C97_00515, partial [Oculatellaceae cyanobacterium]